MSGRVAEGGTALRLSYAPDQDLLYLRLSDAEVAATVELDESVYVDVDAEGRPIGIECLSTAAFLDFLSRHGGEFALPARLPLSSAAD